jgi:hypothetical protein
MDPLDNERWVVPKRSNGIPPSSAQAKNFADSAKLYLLPRIGNVAFVIAEAFRRERNRAFAGLSISHQAAGFSGGA